MYHINDMLYDSVSLADWRTMLLQLLDDLGFQGCYDMVYLPINHRNGPSGMFYPIRGPRRGSLTKLCPPDSER